MGKIFKRILQLPDIKKQSVFLWGPRKVGKSTWIRENLEQVHYIDLLKSDVFADYASRPSLLRERYQNQDQQKPIVIDEIQKCPALLDEVHWLIENTKQGFLLTGSSARKLRRQHSNLLGGRAWRREMRPLAFPEFQEIDCEKIMYHGLLPEHFLAIEPREHLRAYVSDYLREEISQEALVRNLPAFTEFLKVAAITSGELLNYTNVSREVGVSAKVIRGYFEILEDTLLGFRIQPWRKSENRRLVETEKFYLFDVGVSNYLARRKPSPETPEFGKSFEHYILMELMAYKAYKNPELEIRFWRTHQRQEVDFILNDKEVAIEIKSKARVSNFDLRGLKALSEDGAIKKRLLVCQESEPKMLSDSFGQVQVLPLQHFLEQLWNNEIL